MCMWREPSGGSGEREKEWDKRYTSAEDGAYLKEEGYIHNAGILKCGLSSRAEKSSAVQEAVQANGPLLASTIA